MIARSGGLVPLFALLLAVGLPGPSRAQGAADVDTTRGLPPPAVAAPPDTSALAVPAPMRTPTGFRARPDLLQHASLSFAIGLGAGIASEEPAVAAGVSLSLGLVKEVYDPRFDKTDLVADVVGAALAAAVTYWLAR